MGKRKTTKLKTVTRREGFFARRGLQTKTAKFGFIETIVSVILFPFRLIYAMVTYIFPLFLAKNKRKKK